MQYGQLVSRGRGGEGREEGWGGLRQGEEVMRQGRVERGGAGRGGGRELPSSVHLLEPYFICVKCSIQSCALWRVSDIGASVVIVM